MTTLTMSEVIDETLDYSHRYQERPAQIVVGSTALGSSSATTLTFSSGSASISDVLEFGQELLLVTDKSADADPIYTVSRGYVATAKNATVDTGDVGNVNPMYPRYQVQRAIVRSLRPLNRELPYIVSETYTREAATQHVLVPANTLRVLEVGYLQLATSSFGSAQVNRYTELPGWQFVEDLPSSITPLGKVLRVPSVVTADQSLIVKRHVPYAWDPDPVTEASTLDLQAGAEELPVLFATAKLVSGREISRSEIDKVEEWNHEAAIRGGVNLRLMQALWADFYHAMDEARSVRILPRHRSFRKMPHLRHRRPM